MANEHPANGLPNPPEPQAFFLLKEISRDQAGDVNETGFFQTDDQSILQQAVLNNELSADRFIEVPGQQNVAFVGGDAAATRTNPSSPITDNDTGWTGGLLGGQYTYSALFRGDLRATFDIQWDTGGNPRDMEVDFATSFLAAYRALAYTLRGAPPRGGPVNWNDDRARAYVTSEIVQNLGLTAIPAILNAVTPSDIEEFFQDIIDGNTSYVNLPGSDTTLVNPAINLVPSSRNVIDAINIIYASNRTDADAFFNDPQSPKNLRDVGVFARVQAERTQNWAGPIYSPNLDYIGATGDQVTYLARFTGILGCDYLTDGIIKNYQLITGISGQVSGVDQELSIITFTGFSGTPDNYESGKYLVATSSGIEYIDSTGLAKTIDFTGLSGTPNNYGMGEYLISMPDGLQYITLEDTARQIDFTGINGTPENYQEGKFLISTQDGLEWGDAPAGGGDGGGGGANIPSYATTGDLPNNPDNGSLATVGCDLHVACDGQWEVIGANDMAPPEGFPDCVSSLAEAQAYTDYRTAFLAENGANAFGAGLLGRDEDMIHDVCLFAKSNLPASYGELNQVSITENGNNQFKWAMLAENQNIQITATPYNQAGSASCTFKNWTSALAGFTSTNANETVNITQDISITGNFECSLQPQHPSCGQIELFLQPTIAGGSITDGSSYERVVTLQGDPTVDNTQALFTQPTINFDGDPAPNGDRLEVGDDTTFKWIHNYSSPFTIECWVYVDAITTNWQGKRYIPFLSTCKASSDGHGFVFSVDPTNLLFIIYNGTGKNVGVGHAVSDVDISNKWMHLAATWDGETMCLYVDGSLKGSSTPATVPIDNTNSHNMLNIGYTTPSAATNTIPHFNGKMQGIRISKKVVYPSNFNLPVALLENPCPDHPQCSEVILNLQPTVNGAPIADKSNNHHVINNTNVTVDSSSIFDGKNTMRFDGNEDYLSVGDSTTFKFLHDASTDYTIEGWLYLDNGALSNAISPKRIMCQMINSSRDVAIDYFVLLSGAVAYNIHRGSSGTVHKGVQSPDGAFVEGKWNHVAVVYTINNQPKIYINGLNTQAQETTYTNNQSASANDSTSNLVIGAVGPGGTHGLGDEWLGNMQDIRISKKAVYTSNFTPSSSLLIDPC